MTGDKKRLVQHINIWISRGLFSKSVEKDLEAVLDLIQPIPPVWNVEDEEYDCRNCDSVLSSEDKFCRECGREIEWGVYPPKSF